MPQRLHCPQGHQWEAPAAGQGEAAVCPTCGAAGVPASIAAAVSSDATLAPPARPPRSVAIPAAASDQTLAPPPRKPADATVATAAPPATEVLNPSEQTMPLSPPETKLNPSEQTMPLSSREAKRPMEASDATLALPARPAKPTAQAPPASDATLPPPPRSLGPTSAGSARTEAFVPPRPSKPAASDATLPPPSTLGASGATEAFTPGGTRRVPVPGATQKVKAPADEFPKTQAGSDNSGQTMPAVTGLVSGPSVPGYKLLGELGRGGMGVVYKAQHIKLNRLVALKMILSGDYAAEADLFRFRLEAEAVAKVQHPNIVQVYETGDCDGKPYFSLEFVDGGPLDKKLGGNPLPYRQAAEMVQKLADAMDYAHQRNIIHRDLKPPNIMLMKDGTPKITDFGLAKKMDDIDSQTQSGSIMGTPSYMAPEQAEGRTNDIGPPADTYSLGAILYETLVGRAPFKGETVWDTLEQVRSQEPVAPSKLQPKVPRDLETICLKCLEKEPKKRYETAGGLREDLRRFLDGEPILARPTPAWERAWKWSRRRPLAAALTGISALFVVSLIAGGVAFGAYQRQQAQQEAQLRHVAEDEHERAELNFQHAEENFQRARQAVDEMLTGVGQERLAYEPRMEKVRRDLLAKALHFYERFLEEKSSDPTVRWETGRAHLRVGDIQVMLGEQEAAEKSYANSLAFFTALRSEFPDEPRYREDQAVLQNNLGRLLKDAGRTPEAEQSFRAALTLRQGLLDETGRDVDRLEVAAIANNLGILVLGGGRYTEAEPTLRQALQLREQLAAGSTEPVYRQDLARSHNNLGLLLAATGREYDAEQSYHQARDVLQKLATERPNVPDYRQELAVSHNHLGNLWRNTNPKKSEESYQESLRLRDQLVADFPTVPIYRQEQAASHHSLGYVRQAAGRVEEAEKSYNQALAIREKLAADYPKVPEYRHELGSSYNNRGTLLQTSNRLPEAEKVYRLALPLLDKLVAENPDIPSYQQELAATLQNFGVLLQLTKRPEEAQKSSLRAIDLRKQLAERYPKAPGYQKDMGMMQLNLGVLWQMNKNLPEAATSYQQAVDQFTKLANKYPTVPDYRHLLATSSNNLGSLLQETKQLLEAEKAWQKAIDLLTKLKDEQPTVPVYRQELARSYNELGIFLASAERPSDDQVKQAEQAWGQALDLQEKLAADFPKNPVYRQELAKYHGNFGILHAKVNRLDKAEQSYRRAVEILEALEKAYPDVAVYLQEQIGPCGNLIELLLKTGAPFREVEKCGRRLVAVQEKLAQAYPKVADVQSDLGSTLASMASLYLDRKRPEDARQCLNDAIRRQRAAIELNPQQVAYRQQLCGSLLALAQTLLELNDYAAAAGSLAELAKSAPPGWPEHHNAAACLARCAGLAAKDKKLPPEKREELARTYAERAVEFLRQGVAQGYKDVDHLKKAEEFELLRPRDDFKKLVADLEQRAKTAAK